MSPNPLMVQMCVASHTKRIRLGQAANIIVWHHPVRVSIMVLRQQTISCANIDDAINLDPAEDAVELGLADPHERS
jgi:hypothetical protein